VISQLLERAAKDGEPRVDEVNKKLEEALTAKQEYEAKLAAASQRIAELENYLEGGKGPIPKPTPPPLSMWLLDHLFHPLCLLSASDDGNGWWTSTASSSRNGRIQTSTSAWWYSRIWSSAGNASYATQSGYSSVWNETQEEMAIGHAFKTNKLENGKVYDKKLDIVTVFIQRFFLNDSDKPMSKKFKELKGKFR